MEELTIQNEKYKNEINNLTSQKNTIQKQYDVITSLIIFFQVNMVQNLKNMMLYKMNIQN